jgi:hypothetical protein
MKRMIIHLNEVAPVEVKAAKGKMKMKTFNTINKVVSSEAQIADLLFQHKGNIKKHYFSYGK